MLVTDGTDQGPEGLDRNPDLMVRNKSDLGPADIGRDVIEVSALRGTGMDDLKRALRCSLVSDEDLASEAPWPMAPAG